MTEKQGMLRIGVAGCGPRGQSYVRSLAQIDRARIVAAGDLRYPLALEMSRLVPDLALERDAAALFSRSDLDAVVLTDPVGDLFPSIRRALLCNKHVLASTVSSISSRQLQELSRLARRRSRLLMFTEERLFHPALVFLRRMFSTRSGLWHPCYLRALSIPGASHGDGLPIAALAAEELALCVRLLEANPVAVSAIAYHTTGHAEPAAAFINLSYPEGKVASLQVSLTETQEARQWALVTTSKTILVDECDLRAPLKITSPSSALAADSLLRADPPVPISDWPGESTITPPVMSVDTRVEQCRHFVETVIKRDLDQSNASFWAEVALAWEAAQQSMALSGVPVSVAGTSGSEMEQARGRPKLKLIRGKGAGKISGDKKPALTLVSR